MIIQSEEVLENGCIRVTFADGSYRDKTSHNHLRARQPDGTPTIVNDGGKWLTPFALIDLQWVEQHKRDPLWWLKDAVIIALGFAPKNYGETLSTQEKDELLQDLRNTEKGVFVYRAAQNAIDAGILHAQAYKFTLGMGATRTDYKVRPDVFLQWFAGLGIDTPIINASTPIQLLDDLTFRMKEMLRLARDLEIKGLTQPALRKKHLTETLKFSKEQADEILFYIDPGETDFRRKPGRKPKSKNKNS